MSEGFAKVHFDERGADRDRKGSRHKMKMMSWGFRTH